MEHPTDSHPVPFSATSINQIIALPVTQDDERAPLTRPLAPTPHWPFGPLIAYRPVPFRPKALTPKKRPYWPFGPMIPYHPVPQRTKPEQRERPYWPFGKIIPYSPVPRTEKVEMKLPGLPVRAKGEQLGQRKSVREIASTFGETIFEHNRQLDEAVERVGRDASTEISNGLLKELKALRV